MNKKGLKNQSYLLMVSKSSKKMCKLKLNSAPIWNVSLGNNAEDKKNKSVTIVESWAQ